jgi:methylenetetrahydrofolate reductase (NADPH)
MLQSPSMPSSPLALPVEPRFEILPVGKGQEEAAELPEPVRVTVTSSPKHGVDRSLDVAVRLRELGHGATVHLAAREVRDEDHLNALLEKAASAGVDDLLVIGGDAAEPLGPYESAEELLWALAEHAIRPAALGIGAYSEGHPLISDEELWSALERKSHLANYVVTQMCFDPNVLLSWLDDARARGLTLPLFVGAPGPVDRRRLLDISMRIGVGPSLKFMRKQQGLFRRLFTSPEHAAERLYDALAPHTGDGPRGIAGFHLFTFNDLAHTWRWVTERRQPEPQHGAAAPARAGLVDR